MHQIDLSGKIALVTGGGGGIGFAIAKALAGAGAAVAITGRNEDKLASAAATLRQNGAEVLTVRADVSEVGQIRTMVAAVLKRFHRLDILVNNAGMNVPKLALDVTEEDWDRVVDVNLKGVFFCSQEAGRHMIEQGGGKIINIASQMGVVGLYKRAAYCSAKGGVVQLTKVLAIEWARHNINVNAIGPTFIDSPWMQAIFDQDRDFEREVLGRIPMGRLGRTEDVAGAALYLASDLSNFVTGHTLLVDGGYVAW